MMRKGKKPEVMYADIGGMDVQKQEVQEAVELPLTQVYIHIYIYINSRFDKPRSVV